MKKTKCPNCGSSAGMIAVGKDFTHRADVHRESQAAMSPRLFELHYARPNVKSAFERDQEGKLPKVEAWIEIEKSSGDSVVLCEKGVGVRCSKCGWSRRDPVAIPYQAHCECGTSLGVHAHHEKGFQPRHFCPGCSKKRTAEGIQDPDGAVTSFALVCPGGCGTVVGHLSFPEGEREELSFSQSKGSFCNREECARVRQNLDEVTLQARKLSGA